jgi:hypothetical protein
VHVNIELDSGPLLDDLNFLRSQIKKILSVPGGFIHHLNKP